MSAAKSLSLLNSIEFLMRIEKGPDAGKVYRIFPPKIEIGRDPSLQIVLTDPKVSRKQCSLLIKDDILLKDESSRGTTLVNGQHHNMIAIKPGDVITFGDTQIKFMAKSLSAPQATAKKQLPGQSQKAPVTAEKQNARKRFMMFAALIGALVIGLQFMEDPVPVQEEKLITGEQLKEQIEKSEKKQEDLRASVAEQKRSKDKQYLLSVEQHFIKGFRDLQTGQFGRALDSFGTTIASDNAHQKAQQYSRIAKKKKMDIIDTHMRDGIKYKEKVMYDRCISEFEKAIVLINNINSQKYNIAKTQLEECKLLKSGGF